MPKEKEIPLNPEQCQMVIDNYNLVHHVLKKFPCPKDKYEDYAQVGALGLCKATVNFDPQKGAFTTLACKYIKGFLLSYYRAFEAGPIHLPTSVYNEISAGIRNKFQYESYEGLIEANDSTYQATLNGTRNEANEIIEKVYVDSLLEQLEDEERNVFEHILDGHSQSDVSRLYKCSRAKINIKVQEVRKKMKQLLEEDCLLGEIDLSNPNILERI